MEIAVRPAITATMALAAAGMIAAAPTAPALPEVAVPDVQLSGFADDLENALQGFNDFVLDGLVPLNSGLVDAQVSLEQAIFGTNSALNGVLNRVYNVPNMGLGGGQNFLNGLIGIHSTSGVNPADLTWNLLTGRNYPLGALTPNVFNSGQIGGLEGVFVQGLQALNNVTGIPGDSVAASIDAGLIDFNNTLVQGISDFNTFLTQTVELGTEKLIAPLFTSWTGWAPDSLFNGALNRAFDMFNMVLDAGQQSFLGALGAQFDPVDLTTTLLLTHGHVLSDGTIGGLEGVLGQGYMVLIDLLGLLSL